MIDPTYIEALKSWGAHRLAHSTRTLLDHLMGTFDILVSWNATRETCLAGLFHSIYGTTFFANQVYPLPSREKMQDLIGEEAELLVYLFCVTDRREFFINIGCETCTLHDLRSQSPWSGPPHILHQLLTINLANWLEIFPYKKQDISSRELSQTLKLFHLADSFYPDKATADLQAVSEATRNNAAAPVPEGS